MAAFRTAVEGYTGKIGVALFPGGVREALGSLEFDAVVSGDDARLSMQWDVPNLIRELAGPQIVEEARRLPPLKVGDVAATSAGELPARFILHAVVADLEQGIWAGEPTIRHIARGIFVRCEALGIRRLVVAALAEGVAGISPEALAFNIVDALRRHAHNATAVESVVLVLPDEAMFRAFERELVRPKPHASEGTPVFKARGRAPRVQIEYEVTTPAPKDLPPAARASAAPTRPLVAASSRLRLPGWWPFRRSERKKEVPSPAGESAKRIWDSSDSRPLLGGRYVLLEELGRGGCGVVHLSWDLVLRRIVAIKRLREDFSGWDLLQREAAIAMGLDHPGIVRVHHFEPRPDQGGPYLVMEHLPWSTGERWAAEAGQLLIPARAVVEVGVSLCDALAYAHDRGVLHLDIKPGNVFVDPAGERTKLADFGIAKLLSAGRRALQMMPAGTPVYMAPEQMRSGERLGPATDVYQLAATLWDLLTGQAPTGWRGSFETNERDRARALEVLSAALAADPDSRPRDARAFRGLLGQLVAA